MSLPVDWKRRTGLLSFVSDDRGQGLVEYGLILGLVAMVAIGALLTLGGSVNTTFGGAANSLNTDPRTTVGADFARP
jgi:pilus assembly protein Flp/PilA